MTVRYWFSKWSTFDGHMAAAEIVDAYRIFPRIMLLGYFAFVWHICDWMLQFYFDLPAADKAETQIVLFCGGVIGVVTTLGTAIFSIYNSSARDWAAYHTERRLLQAPTVQPVVVASATTVTTGVTP